MTGYGSNYNPECPITIALDDGGFAHGFQNVAESRERQIIVVVVNEGIHGLLRMNEGTTWIRGHHAPGSKEAQALLAAFLLTR